MSGGHAGLTFPGSIKPVPVGTTPAPAALSHESEDPEGVSRLPCPEESGRRLHRGLSAAQPWRAVSTSKALGVAPGVLEGCAPGPLALGWLVKRGARDLLLPGSAGGGGGVDAAVPTSELVPSGLLWSHGPRTLITAGKVKCYLVFQIPDSLLVASHSRLLPRPPPPRPRPSSPPDSEILPTWRTES